MKNKRCLKLETSGHIYCFVVKGSSDCNIFFCYLKKIAAFAQAFAKLN